MHSLRATAQPDALLLRIATLIDSGHAGAARSLLAAIRRVAPPAPRHAELAARLAMLEGRHDRARQELDSAIADAPDHAGLRRLRAEVRRQLDDSPGAAADAAEAVVLEPSDPVAKALLGVLLIDLRRTDEAVACLREAVAARPTNPAFREGLAAALDAAGDAEGALATLTAGIAALPGHIGLRNAAVLHCVRRRDFTAAVALAEEARLAGVMDACLFGLMGHALSSLARHGEASDAYAEALKLGPEDPYVRHLAAAAGTVPGADRAPVEYLRAVFDGYAERFETHLISLNYRIPGLIRAVLLGHPGVAAGETLGPALDLGCGTGLLAVALSDLDVRPMVGVDISSAMLEQSAAKQLYAELHEADVMDFLREDIRTWPLILAADVLCYFGALDGLLAVARPRLAPGGWFVFTSELLQPDRQGIVPGNGDWALGRQGRFSHAEGYVTRAAIAAGFTVHQAMPAILRSEADAPVDGLVFVLQRCRDDH